LGIIKIMTDPRSSSGTAEAVAYCGWHPEHGYALQTCGHDQQHAASLLMRTDLAGNHGWSVQPLYAALSPTPQTAGGVREAIAEWLLRDRGLKDASIEAIKEYRGETYLKAAMLDAGAQAIINDIWHPPQPLSSIPPADAARHRRTALLVLKAALSLPSTQERTP
jgi:hypothetical protein